MKSNDFAEQWQAAVTLAEVRGWKLEYESDEVLHVHLNAQLPWEYVFPRDARGLASLVDRLSQGDPKPMDRDTYIAVVRYSQGWTDARGLYGRSTS